MHLTPALTDGFQALPPVVLKTTRSAEEKNMGQAWSMRFDRPILRSVLNGEYLTSIGPNAAEYGSHAVVWRRFDFAKGSHR